VARIQAVASLHSGINLGYWFYTYLNNQSHCELKEWRFLSCPFLVFTKTRNNTKHILIMLQRYIWFKTNSFIPSEYFMPSEERASNRCFTSSGFCGSTIKCEPTDANWKKTQHGRFKRDSTVAAQIFTVIANSSIWYFVDRVSLCIIIT
jgi:hypothetical protein